jgi:glutathione S-transferase
MSHDLILHHYDFSSFSEKIRLVMGWKGLAWEGVVIPPVAPKPNLTALTGGYRHTPVLQIGADIYCDTRLIARELDRRHPMPALCPEHLRGFAFALEGWAERDFFWPIARFVSGLNAELTPEMNADRAAMRGKRPPSVERLKTVARESFRQVQTQVPLVDNMLSDGRAFVISDAPTIADFALYHGFWFMSAMPIDCSALLKGFPRITSWMDRIRSIGHGNGSDISPAAALEVARYAKPEPLRSSSPLQFDLELGDDVTVRPDGYTTAGVEGRLVYCDRDEITIHRQNESLGDLNVHFPRVGYTIAARRDDEANAERMRG